MRDKAFIDKKIPVRKRDFIPVLASGNEDADETLQKLRDLPLSTRLELIKKYAAKYKLILNFGSQNADKQEESNSQEKSNNQEEIQK